MARKRIDYVVWGVGAKKLRLEDGYAMREDYQAGIDAVARSLERRTGLVCCAGPRDEGIEKGKDPRRHYSLTLGRPVRGGGYCPEGEVWFGIPVS